MEETILLTEECKKLFKEIVELIKSFPNCLWLECNVFVSHSIRDLLENKGNQEDLETVCKYVKEWGEIRFAPEFVNKISNLDDLKEARRYTDQIIKFRNISKYIETLTSVRKIFEKN